MLPTFLSLIVLFIWQTDIRNWIRNIEQHASDNVNKILVGNKADTDESKRVSTQAPLILSYDLLIL
jgi:GTPase SAR1 family protein